MQVRDYSEHLYNIATSAYPDGTINIKSLRTIGAYTAAASVAGSVGYNFLMDNILLSPIYHGSGLLAMVIDRTVDNFSTVKAVHEMDDKFFEYGLENYFREGRPSLPDHPKYSDLARKLPLDILSVVVAGIIPPFGHAFAATAIQTYRNNSTAAKRIRTAKKAGDAIKAKLDDGSGDDDIQAFLDELKSMDRKELRKYLDSYKST